MNHLTGQDESVYEQAAFDSPANQKSRSNKKREQILSTWEKPIWPRMARILFISMLVLSSAMALAELKNAMIPTFDGLRFLKNTAISLWTVWAIYTCLLVPCCLAGSYTNSRSYEKRKAESGITDETEEDRRRSRRAVRRLNASYTLQLRICLIGLVLLTLLQRLTLLL